MFPGLSFTCLVGKITGIVLVLKWTFFISHSFPGLFTQFCNSFLRDTPEFRVQVLTTVAGGLYVLGSVEDKPCNVFQ